MPKGLTFSTPNGQVAMPLHWLLALRPRRAACPITRYQIIEKAPHLPPMPPIARMRVMDHRFLYSLAPPASDCQ